MNMANSSGPITEPCGAPDIATTCLDVAPSSTTECDLYDKRLETYWFK